MPKKVGNDREKSVVCQHKLTKYSGPKFWDADILIVHHFFWCIPDSRFKWFGYARIVHLYDDLVYGAAHSRSTICHMFLQLQLLVTLPHYYREILRYKCKTWPTTLPNHLKQSTSCSILFKVWTSKLFFVCVGMGCALLRMAKYSGHV